MAKKKALILIDGIHKADNTIESIEKVKKIYDFDVHKLLWIGGTEKIKTKSSFSQAFEEVFAISVYFAKESEKGAIQVQEALRTLLKQGGIDIVFQLCGAPQVQRPITRRLANIAVSFGASYIAGGTIFQENQIEIRHQKPSLGLYATNKRVGKTAFGSYVACLLSGIKGFKTNWEPIIITHSRGGPPEPIILKISQKKLDKPIEKITKKEIFSSRFRTDYLEKLLEFDLHGASDVFEDALILSAYLDEWEKTGQAAPFVSVIGCRRAGAGYFQEFAVTNVGKGIQKANSIRGNIIIHEGSGGEHPPVAIDGTIYFIPSDIDLDLLEDFPGIDAASLVVIANCQKESVQISYLQEIEKLLGRNNPDTPILRTHFIPEIISAPKDIRGQKTVLMTTAPDFILKKLQRSIERQYGCKVLEVFNCLDHQSSMKKAIDQTAKKCDLFLFEIKAQGVEGAKYCQDVYEKDFYYINNVPQEVDEELRPCASNENLDAKILQAVDAISAKFHKKP